MQNLENVISSLEALNHAAPSQIFRDAITFLKMKEPTKAIWLYDRPNH